jgi:hypothetical protein
MQSILTVTVKMARLTNIKTCIKNIASEEGYEK